MNRLSFIRLLLSAVLLFLFVPAPAQTGWENIRTAEQACQAWPEQMKTIFQNLDLNYNGLEKVKAAWERKDLPAACSELLAYYQTSKVALARKKELPQVTQKTNARADSILQNIFTFQRVTGQVPVTESGHLDWNCTGPEDDIEWAWALNRHYPLNDLLDVYLKTGNPVYARYASHFIADWVLQSLPYPAKRSSTALWRGLEVSFRVKVWAAYFYTFTGTDYLSPATRLLILSSLPAHAHYARNFHAQNNWLTMEMSGLATLATSWPEWKESKSWLDYSIGAMTESLKEQVYPDGAQTELTSHYHWTALSNFALFEKICDQAGVHLPGSYTKTVEAMRGYLAWTMRPSGYGILNNDGDLDYTRDETLRYANEYGRGDWTYIATNGKTGTKPRQGPSVAFPWAGQLISRSGYGKNAQWSFFDIGPWGSGHQHNDKLHLSVSAWGRDLLVDAGRFAYRGEVAAKFRKYALGSQSHNVILIDGKGQGPGPLLAKKAIPAGDLRIRENGDYARGAFSDFADIEGSCKHTRTVTYERGKYWIVLDQIHTDRPRKIDVLWHWHPDCKVERDGQRVFTTNKKGNLQVIPAGLQNWTVTQVRGQESPEIQGWYSEAYNAFEASTASVWSTQIETDSRFVWLLYPSKKKCPPVRIDITGETDTELRVRIRDDKNGEWFYVIPLQPATEAAP